MLVSWENSELLYNNPPANATPWRNLGLNKAQIQGDDDG